MFHRFCTDFSVCKYLYWVLTLCRLPRRMLNGLFYIIVRYTCCSVSLPCLAGSYWIRFACIINIKRKSIWRKKWIYNNKYVHNGWARWREFYNLIAMYYCEIVITYKCPHRICNIIITLSTHFIDIPTIIETPVIYYTVFNLYYLFV